MLFLSDKESKMSSKSIPRICDGDPQLTQILAVNDGAVVESLLSPEGVNAQARFASVLTQLP